MQPLYIANPDHTLGYTGNRICKPMSRINTNPSPNILKNRVQSFRSEELWEHVARINQGMNTAVNKYFKGLDSVFVLTPVTTRLLSAPKAIYAKKKSPLDALPFKIEWFGSGDEVFLSQSAQIYMELSVIPKEVDSAYCLSNSIRSEKSDPTHFAEFHMIEYEGKISQKQNKKVIVNLLREIVGELLKNNYENLSFFLKKEDLDQLEAIARKGFGTEVTFMDALDILYTKTKNPKYKEFTMKNFGAWEEVKLSAELDDMVIVSEFPYAESAFYQSSFIRNGNEVAETADFIWPGYRELAGGGHRAKSFKELETAIKRFNLPISDYKYYLESRKSGYVETSGFGMGWERVVQAVLKMPYIYSAALFPRVNSTPYL